jgi:four helix bundle protein
MRDDRPNTIIEMTFFFSLSVIEFCEKLNDLKKFNISNQLFRSGTSIGANVREAQNAESRADFIHKMKIAAKETDETIYWLLICKESDFLPSEESLLYKIENISKVLSKIIATSKKNKNTSI